MNSQDVPMTEEGQPQRGQEGLPVSDRLALSVEEAGALLGISRDSCL